MSRKVFNQASKIIKEYRWPIILMMFLFYALESIVQIHIISCVFLSPILELLFASWMLDLIRYRDPKKLDISFLSLETYFSSVVAMVIQSISFIVGFCLFIVFGVRWTLGQSQAIYILKDRPYYSGYEAICKSWELMDGLKNQLFKINLILLLEMFVVALIAIGVFSTGNFIDPGTNLFTLVSSFLFPLYSVATFLSTILFCLFVILYWVPKYRAVQAIFYSENIYPRLLMQELRERGLGNE